MQRHELLAWLGDNHGLTNDEINDLHRAADDIEQRYPDDDEAQSAALTTAYRLLMEDPEDVVDSLGADLTRARIAEANTIAGLRQAALTLVVERGRGVASQLGFAERAGVDRHTVLGWLGKRNRTGR